MDMQNVSNLVIPEGNVNTIHNSNKELIWGRLAYDTKYAGNTLQNGTPTPDVPVNIQVVTGEQAVTVTGKNLWGFASSYTNNNTTNSWVLPDTAMAIPSGNYTFSCETANTNNVQFSWKYSDNVSHSSVFTNGKTSVTFTEDVVKVAIRMKGPNSISNIQLEAGSTPTVFEPYQSQTYPVSLGSIELCKIGDYQDYIYKSGDDWYVHKAIDGFVANGSENWNKNGSSRQDLSIPNIMRGSASNNPVISSRYISRFSTSVNNSVFLSGAANALCVYDTIHATGASTWTSWLSSNNTTFYYALATPTDTQITDTTLIGQLDAIHQFLTRYGYNSNVSGNLPIIIDKTDLS